MKLGRKGDKPAKPKAGAAPRKPKVAPPETRWLTDGGYQLSERLVAAHPGRPEAAPVTLIANEIIETHVRAGRRGLAVCAPAQGAGVTFVAANLGGALAHAGLSILVVDANLGAPGLQEMISPPSEGPGLQQLLDDEALDIADVLHSEVLPGLSIIYAGAPRQDGRDALGTDRFREMAARWLRDYECTLVIAAPANRSTTPLDVASAMGHALIVARRGRSYAEDVETLAGQMAADNIPVIGTVLNGG